jgi:hypothetical protein
MLLLAILVWGLLAIIVGIEANARGRSAIGWSTLAFLISPFVAGGILLLPTWHFGRRSIVGAKHPGCATGATWMGIS